MDEPTRSAEDSTPQPAHPPTLPPDQRPRPSGSRAKGCCDQCGYSLVGLPYEGLCPECGEPYTDISASRLEPFPSAWSITLRIGWPLMVLALTLALGGVSSNEVVTVCMVLLGYAMLLVAPINTYFQVRRMLKRSLPQQKRTRGGIAVLRALGTTACVLVFLVFLAPLVLFGACLIMMSGGW